MRLDTPVTAAQGARLTGVSRHLIAWWVSVGKLTPIGRVGRSPLYRLGDLYDVEREMRQSSKSHRHESAA